MKMLETEKAKIFDYEKLDDLRSQGRVQLDFLVELTENSEQKTIVFSLLAERESEEKDLKVMTQNTLILVDTMENHLHVQWQHNLLNTLKEMVENEELGVNVIATTHSEEIMKGYALEIEEKGIRKGAYILDNLKD